MMSSQFWKWVLGLSYIVAVASIWIAASFVVQSVVDDGVSPFLITYICNSLFVIYVPLFEIVRYLENAYGSLWFWRKKKGTWKPFSTLTWKQFGLVVGKGLLDNVLSDYLWAKAVLLTSTTVATAGLTIQVPLAAIVDSVMGNIPSLLDFVGAAAILVGFAGINIPRDAFCKPKGANLENGNLRSTDEGHVCRVTEDADQLPDTYSANYSKLSLSTMSCKFRVCRNEDTHTKKVMAVESSCSAAIAYSGSESWEVLLNPFYKLKAPTTIPFMQKCSVGYLYQNNLNPVQLIFFQSVEEKVSCAANILSEC